MTEVQRIWDTVAELERKIAKVTKQINERLDSIEQTLEQQANQIKANKEQK